MKNKLHTQMVNYIIETGETRGNYNPNNGHFLKELLEPEIYVKTFNVTDYDLAIPTELIK